MAVAPEALKKFLAREFKQPPRFKGMAPDRIKDHIYDATGVDFKEITKSRPHQLEGTAFALWMQRSLLLYWMRLGKSKMALDWMTHLRRANLVHKPCLIIAHAPIGVEVWEGQAAMHSKLRVKCVRSGEGALDSLLDGIDNDYDAVIISRSMLQTLFTIKKLNRKKVLKLYPDQAKLSAAAACFDHCVIDETHFYSNPTKLPFLLAHSIVGSCKYRLGLTGTPIGRYPFAIWAQASLIDEGRRFSSSYPFFQMAYGKKAYNHFAGGWRGLAFDKKKMPALKERLDTLALSYGKGEVRSAEVFTGQIKLRMYAEQMKTYNDGVKKLVSLRFNEQVDLDAQFTRLRQIASGFLPFTDNDGQRRVLHFPSVKLDWLEEFASEVPRNCQCIIFHEFIHTGELICERLTKAKVSHAWLHGDTPNKKAEIEKFTSGKAQILVANTATGGTSIDLSQADYLCFFESPCSPIVRTQAEARPMGRGLDRALAVDDLLCSPVEQKILGYIQEGEDCLRKLLRGDDLVRKGLFAK